MKKLALLTAFCVTALAHGADWPRQINSTEGVVTIYQPQIGSFSGNSMSARAAISVTPAGETGPIFGAVWMDCRVLTDRPTRTVKILDLRVKQIRFPNRPEDETAAVTASLEQEIPRWDLTFSLDELLESLDTAQKERETAREIDLAPPQIIVVDHPAVLVLIDGDPIWTDIEGTNLRRVANTPYFIAEDISSARIYLRGGDIWYSAREIRGPWSVTKAPPHDVVTLANESAADDAAGQSGVSAPPAPGTGKIPEIVVSTEPAELIATDGPIQLSPIDGTGLLYASNTQSRLFLEIATRSYFILISGRWYQAASLKGPWTYIASDKLPADFAEIPPGSDRDAVLASIAGTVPAKEAVLDAQIPQTAEVDRMETTEQVDYDGDPQFEPIENTEMDYAVNTATPVIRTGGRYYSCDRGIWFESARPRGPWGVCIAVPPVIYTIPPRCPVYFVRYVRVYSYTPRVAYVGYTAGYTGCYVYNHTVVYGTGYRYHPWYRHFYYPRPWTWGFGVHYEPWTGWSMGYTTGWWRPRGWFAYNWRVVHPGWWGPVGYRPAYHPVRGPVYREGYHPVYRPLPVASATPGPLRGTPRTTGPSRSPTLYDRWATGVRRPSSGSMPRTTPDISRPAPVVQPRQPLRTPETRPTPQPIRVPESRPAPQPNRVPEGQPTPAPTRQPERQPAPPQPITIPETSPRPAPGTVRVAPPETPAVPRPVQRENNVFTTPEGNILRKTQQGWQQRAGGTWKPAGPAPAQSGVERDAQVRQRATERSTSFRTPSPPQRPASSPPQVQKKAEPQPRSEKVRK